MPRAVIFDFNGTLSDDEPVLERLFRAMSERLGSPLGRDEYYRELAGLSDREIVERILARNDLPADRERREALLREKIDAYKVIVAEEPPIGEDAAAFVRAVAEQRPVAIASGALREEVEQVLAAAGLDGVFAAVVCVDDVERGKPDPEGYALALARLNAATGAEPPVAPPEVLVLEDADAGVQAAKAAGMRCAAVRSPAYSGRPVAADVELDALMDAARLLRLRRPPGRRSA